MRIALVILSFLFQTQFAGASLVTFSFVGNESDSDGTVDFPGDAEFSGSITIDTTAGRDPNSGFFSFVDAVTSIELSTSLGQVSYDPTSADPFFLTSEFIDSLTQVDTPLGQTLSAIGGLPLGPPDALGLPSNVGFSGAIDGLAPFGYSFQLVSTGSDPVFFTDPEFLLSNIDMLGTDNLIGGLLSLLTAQGEIRLGFAEVFIEGAPATPTPEVPIPGALPLMLSGLAGFGWMRKRARTKLSASKTNTSSSMSG